MGRDEDGVHRTDRRPIGSYWDSFGLSCVLGGLILIVAGLILFLFPLPPQ